MGKDTHCTPNDPCCQPDCIDCLIRESTERLTPPPIGGIFTARDNIITIVVRCQIMPGVNERQRELASLSLANLATMFNNAGALALPNYVTVEVTGRRSP